MVLKKTANSYLISFLSNDSEYTICVISSTSRSATIKTNNATSKNEENLCFVWWVNFLFCNSAIYLLCQSRWFHLPIRELSSPIPRWTTKASPCAVQTNSPTILGQFEQSERCVPSRSQRSNAIKAAPWTERGSIKPFTSVFSRALVRS